MMVVHKIKYLFYNYKFQILVNFCGIEQQGKLLGCNDYATLRALYFGCEHFP
jgi:hypothetical protein